VDITVYTESLVAQQPCIKNKTQITANSDVNVLDINLGEVFITPDQQQLIIDTVCPPLPPPVPEQVTGVVASSTPSRNGSLGVKVTWNSAKDTSNRGLGVIQSYTITAEPSIPPVTVLSPLTSVDIYGLNQSVSYRFILVATNGVGSSIPSALSNEYTPSPVPSAPRNVVASAGDNTITVTWDIPTQQGDSITEYTITSIPPTELKTVNSFSPRIIQMVGLQIGTTYTFYVIAKNDNGNSIAGISNSVRAVSYPSVPRGIYGTPGDSILTAFWISPQVSGGSSIALYKVSPEPLPPGYTPVSVTVTDQKITDYSITLRGLSNGSSYSIKVEAISSAIVNSVALSSSATSPESYLVATVPDAPILEFDL